MTDDFDETDLAELRVDLPNHAFASEERLCAEQRGGGYELVCPPRFAYGLNRGDVVLAAEGEDGVLEVTRVIHRSGHQTLRLTFLRRALPRVRVPMLDDLMDLGVSCEGCTSGPVAVDVPPGVDLTAVRARLDAWRSDGLIEYEWATARVRGSFDVAEDLHALASMRRMRSETFGTAADA